MKKLKVGDWFCEMQYKVVKIFRPSRKKIYLVEDLCYSTPKHRVYLLVDRYCNRLVHGTPLYPHGWWWLGKKHHTYWRATEEEAELAKKIKKDIDIIT